MYLLPPEGIMVPAAGMVLPVLTGMMVPAGMVRYCWYKVPPGMVPVPYYPG